MMREMKDSGYDWIGEIPNNWMICQLKYGISILTDYTANGSFATLADNVTYLDEGYARVVRLTDLRVDFNNEGVYVSEYSYNFLKKSSLYGGEILVANVGAYSGLMCEMPKVSFKATLGPNMFLILTDVKRLLPRYLYFLSVSKPIVEQLEVKATASAQPKLNKQDVKSIYITLPPTDDQKTIANYLDKKCLEIDSLTTEIQTQIDTLEQYKRSVISEAVTKGLNPNAEMKDSDVEWIGMMPSNWRLKKLKYLFKIEKRIARKEGLKVLSITQRGIIEKDITTNEGQQAESYINYQIVNLGDFAMNHMDLLTGWIDISKIAGVTSPDYRVFILINSECVPEYYLYLFQSCYLNKTFFSLGQGVSGLGRWRLPASMFLNFVLPMPHQSEQKEIAMFLDEKCTEINSIIADKQTLLETLDSYKKSIIYDYVTGKKEVPA